MLVGIFRYFFIFELWYLQFMWSRKIARLRSNWFATYNEQIFIVVWFFAKVSFCIGYVIPFSKKVIFFVKVIFAANLTNVDEFIRILSTFLFGVFSCMLMCLAIKRSTIFMATISKSQFSISTLTIFHHKFRIMQQGLLNAQKISDKTSKLL